MKCRVYSIYRGEGMVNKPSLMKKANGVPLMQKSSEPPLREEGRPPLKASKAVKYAPR